MGIDSGEKYQVTLENILEPAPKFFALYEKANKLEQALEIAYSYMQYDDEDDSANIDDATISEALASFAAYKANLGGTK